MSISTLRKIYIVILVAVVVLMVIWIVQDPSDYKLLAKGAGLLIACIVAIIKLESHYSAAAERTYERQYQDLIGNAFTENKSAKKQLIKGLILFNEKNMMRQSHGLTICEKTACFRQIMRPYSQFAHYAFPREKAMMKR